MNRLHLAFATCLTLVACGPKEFGSVCSEVPAPEACMTACDPAPGAANACPAGFHCSADGKCDAQCTVGGGQCGDGYTCTADGYCVDDGSGSGGNGPDASCPAINFTPMPTTPSIQLVLDRSGSMSSIISNGQSRYAAMRDALVKNVTGVVTQLETKAYFGSELYTCNGNNLDLINVPRALSNANAIRLSLDGTGPGDNTPTAAAIDAARTGFVTTPPPAGSPPVIVLATDGLPNSCNQNLTQAQADAQSVAAAAAAYAAGFPVYVLAINQSSQHFQDVANAGQGHVAGQPDVTYYPVASAAALATAFQTIINGVISCDLKLTSSIDDVSAMNGTVLLNGQTLTYGTDWTLVNGNIIRLTGAACTMLKTTTNPAVSASFPCGSVIF
ncbi:MAG: VWA domain-containing protein [Myxococcales bacterium]|nr:VWA domain-containing protein [Myxococcales bacterium]